MAKPPKMGVVRLSSSDDDVLNISARVFHLLHVYLKYILLLHTICSPDITSTVHSPPSPPEGGGSRWCMVKMANLPKE